MKDEEVIDSVYDVGLKTEFDINEYFFYHKKHTLRYDFIHRWEKKLRQIKNEKYDYENFIEVSPTQHPDALGFATKKGYYKSGAERVAYFMTEVN